MGFGLAQRNLCEWCVPPYIRLRKTVYTKVVIAVTSFSLCGTQRKYPLFLAGTLRINEEDGSITLLGSFHEASTGARGSFLVYAERENPSVHISGLWIGQVSYPAPFFPPPPQL